MITTTASGRTWHFSHALGRATAEHNGKTGGFQCPVSIALAPDDILFVLSRGFGYNLPSFEIDIGRRIGKMTLDEDHLGDFARHEFTWPTAIARAGDGYLYTADEYDNVIAVYDPDRIYTPFEYDPNGESVSKWGEAGSEEGQLDGPSGLAFDAEDNLFIVDGKNDRVQKFTKEGRYLMGWGGSGQAEGQFRGPWGITIDGEGSVYVADWGNDRVQKFTPDGEHLMSFSAPAGQGGDLSRPSDVAVDSDGDVYVTDWGNRRVQIYEPGGESIVALYGDAINPNDSKAGTYIINRDPETAKAYKRVEDLTSLGRFRRPVAIEIDAQDRVIIADSAHRLQVYSKDRDYTAPRVTLELT